MLPFRSIDITDKEQAEECLRKVHYHLCEHCFVDLYIWQKHYHTQLCFADGFLLVRMQTVEEEKTVYLAPIGDGDLRKAVETIRADARECGVPFVMGSIAEGMKTRLEALFPGEFVYEAVRDSADYIYLSQNLITLSGKKLHSKRNFINRFCKTYENRWSYERMTTAHIPEVRAFHREWCLKNGCAQNLSLEGERCCIDLALDHFEALEMRGGLLRVDGKIIAFSLGAQSEPDMFVVQVEKADADIPGAYPMINQQFAEANCRHIQYINREDDLGLPGLRQAKLSYHPEMINVKYMAVPKEDFAP